MVRIHARLYAMVSLTALRTEQAAVAPLRERVVRRERLGDAGVSPCQGIVMFEMR